MSIVYIPGEPCPCGCGATGSKLAYKTGHVVRACKCQSCIGRRNRAKGQRAQATGHRALGGEGFTPTHEETHGGYDVRCQVEHKTGEQVPASFRKFIALDWTRRAFSQAQRAQRVGDGSLPAVMIDGRYLVVDCKRGPEPVA